MRRGQGATASLATTGRPVRTLALADLDVTGPVLIKLDVEGAEVAAIKGAARMDAIFVYEDWPRSGMPVTGRRPVQLGTAVSRNPAAIAGR